MTSKASVFRVIHSNRKRSPAMNQARRHLSCDGCRGICGFRVPDRFLEVFKVGTRLVDCPNCIAIINNLFYNCIYRDDTVAPIKLEDLYGGKKDGGKDKS